MPASKWRARCRHTVCVRCQKLFWECPGNTIHNQGPHVLDSVFCKVNKEEEVNGSEWGEQGTESKEGEIEKWEKRNEWQNKWRKWGERRAFHLYFIAAKSQSSQHSKGGKNPGILTLEVPKFYCIGHFSVYTSAMQNCYAIPMSKTALQLAAFCLERETMS